MNQKWIDNAQRYSKRNRQKKLWQKVVGFLGCVVVFCTTYALILPAITMEQTAYCGQEAHVHDEACYVQEPVLVCTEEETPDAHIHGEDCYALEEVLSCGQEEQEPHVHEDGCYTEQECYVCGQEESKGHVHGEDCFREETTLTCQEAEVAAHYHDDGCYTEQACFICGQEEGEDHTHSEECLGTELVLTCGLEETEGHAHDESCYETTKTLICELEESEGHTHTEECLGTELVLSCGMEETEGHVHTEACYDESQSEPVLTCELEEHEHTLACYSDPTADVESASVWEATLPELTGVWTDDVIAIAESQLGYTESARNYIVLEDGVTTMGYTRYGEWYGDAYGDWCAMFASFCIHYAGVEDFPLEASCSEWVSLLEEMDAYVTVEAAAPVPGDLVFFDKDNDGSADHVGIVTSWENGSLNTIEGNAGDQVTRKSYEDSEGTILGYGLLPIQLTQQEQAQVDEVIAMIDDMPSADEIDAQLAAYEEAEDYEGEEAYYTEVSQQVTYVYHCYSRLSDSQKEHVTNADKLLELEYIWSVTVLADVETVDVYAVNSFWYNSNGGSLIVYSDSGRTVGQMGMDETDFNWWYAVIVEPDNGQLVVKEIELPGEGVSKSALAASANGFILLFHPGTLGVTVDVSVGDYVAVSSDFWKTTSSSTYTGTSYGTVTFQDTPVMVKAEKDNTSQLQIVPSADTSELIEVNLYDYNADINTLYNSNTKYPGFQQDNGAINVGSSFDASTFNFGNNITSDLAAGIESLTNKGGTINKTISTYNGVSYGLANIAIEDAMSLLLQNDYPALADGTSLDYLFSNSAYATKQNSANINGLFRYNSTTGAYTFNSRENHAQFDADTNTFTLYKQIISSNYMMYPFGNFLPFNDITKLSAKASTIDRAYLQTIVKSAEYKYQCGAGEEYGTLATNLTKFISLMDSTYGTGWDAYDAVNRYFATVGLNQTFSAASPTLDDGTPVLENVYSIDYDEPTDFFFGMEMKMNFYQPKGGLTGLSYQEPMEFYFTGDDDVWIYIDNVLFLDLSGIHRHVGGKIDFVNGVIYYYTLDTATGDVSDTAYKTVRFEEAFRAAYAEGSAELSAALATLNEKGTFRDYSTHSFRFYYIERGAGSGVCRMNFNFPLLKTNTISIEKELATDADVEILGDPDYRFQILAADENGNKTETPFLKAGQAYTLYDRDGTLLQQVVIAEKNQDGSIKCLEVYNASGILVRVEENGVRTDYGEVLTIDGNGMISLKAGQKAEFVGISESSGKYYVRELLDGTDLEQYGNITVSGETTTTRDDVVIDSESFIGMESGVKDMSDGAAAFCFTNTVTTSKLGSLTVSKDLKNYTPSEEPQYFDIAVTLDGTPLPVGTRYILDGEEKTVQTEGIITIAADETAVISNILSGTAFTVQETSGSAEGYTVTYSAEDAEVEYTENGVEGVIRVKADVKITVTNAGTGTSVTIPGSKSVSIPDGGEHTFIFRLSEVTDETGRELKEDGLSNYTASAALIDGVQSFEFMISYATDLDTLPQTYYYRITEDPADDAVENDTVYIVQVTVSGDEKGAVSAEVTGIWKGRMLDGVPAELEAYDGNSADFTNVLTGELTLSKTVTGDATALEQDFTFELTLSSGTSGLETMPTEYPAVRTKADGTTAEETVVFIEGKATVQLKHGESLRLYQVPYGAEWTVSETDGIGFSAGFEVTEGDDTRSISGNTASGSIPIGGAAVSCTNAATYSLPQTGGIGIIPGTALGLVLMISALSLMVIIRRRKKGGS